MMPRRVRLRFIINQLQLSSKGLNSHLEEITKLKLRDSVLARRQLALIKG